jgi:hypothetical protein
VWPQTPIAKCASAGFPSRVSRSRGGEYRSQSARPGANRRPVSCIAGRHLFESRYQVVWEAQCRGVKLAAEDLDGERRQPGKLPQLLVELSACILSLLRIIVKWPQREDRYRSFHEGLSMARQQALGVLVSAKHKTYRAAPPARRRRTPRWTAPPSGGGNRLPARPRAPLLRPPRQHLGWSRSE